MNLVLGSYIHLDYLHVSSTRKLQHEFWKEILFKNTSCVQYQRHNSKSVSILRVHVHCTTVLFCAMAWKLKLMSSLSPGKLQPGQTCKTTANVWLGWPQKGKMSEFLNIYYETYMKSLISMFSSVECATSHSLWCQHSWS